MLVQSHNQYAFRWNIAIIRNLMLYQNRSQSSNVDEDTAFSAARIPLLGAHVASITYFSPSEPRNSIPRVQTDRRLITILQAT